MRQKKQRHSRLFRIVIIAGITTALYRNLVLNSTAHISNGLQNPNLILTNKKKIDDHLYVKESDASASITASSSTNGNFIVTKAVLNKSENTANEKNPNFVNTTHPKSSFIYLNVEKFLDRSLRVELPDSNRKSIAFLHVGKCGGSTISALLRNGCHHWLPKPCEGRVPDINSKNKIQPSKDLIQDETIASLRIQHYYHVVDVPYEGTEVINDSKTGMQSTSSYVITLRNPFHRTISAFLFSHPKNMMAMNQPPEKLGEALVYLCYPSPRYFALYAAGKMPMNELKVSVPASGSFQYLNCTSIAQNALQGLDERFIHLYHNIGHYVKGMPSSAEVFVIRKENLWDDWFKLNELLGQSQTDIERIKESNGNHLNKNVWDHSNLPIKEDLTDSHVRSICQFLKDEIRTFIILLNRAVNLSNDDILDSIQDIYHTCPDQMVELMNEEFLDMRDKS